MAGGVDVNIGADTRDFDRAVRSGMVEPVTDAQAALDGYTKAGDKAGDQLTATFKTQQQQTVELKDKLEQLNRSIRDGSGPAYRKVAQDSDQFVRHTSEGFEEVKDSAKQNAIETAASFDGSFASIAGGAQGLTSEFLAGFGPQGVIAGLAIAGGIGLLQTAIEGAGAATEQDKQLAGQLAQAWIDAGTDGKNSVDGVAQSLENMATDTGDHSTAVITLQEAWNLARRSGTSYGDIVKSISSGSATEIDRAKASVDRLITRQDLLKVTTQQVGVAGTGAALNQQAAVRSLSETLGRASAQAKSAQRSQELAAEAGLSTRQLKADEVSQVHDAYKEAADGATDFISKEHGTLNVEKFLESFEKRKKAIREYHKALDTLDLSPEALKFIESQGEDTAAAYVKGYQHASDKQKAQLNEIWSTAGRENASTYGEAMGHDLSRVKLPPPKVDRPTVPAPDTSKLDYFLRQPAVKQIVIEGVTRTGQRVF